jgi:ATP-dependent DNA helicase DinG
MANTTKQEALAVLLHRIFNEMLPQYGFAPREKQIELAGEVLSSLGRLDIFLAESEVGTGKTLAYLIPSVLARRSRLNENSIPTVLWDGKQAPIAIATSSIALQRAIEHEAIPMLSGILMENGIIKLPLTRVLRKGKGHFLCERRLSHFIRFADAQTGEALSPLVGGALVDLAGAENLTPYVKRHICVDESCGQDCSRYGECRYMRYLREAKSGGYDFQVCNHNYLLADLIRRSKGQRPLIPDCQGVVIDEAHKFLDAARQMYGCSLSLHDFIRTVDDVRDFTFAPGAPTAGIAREADGILSKSLLLFRFLNKEAAEAQTDDEAERYATKILVRSESLMRALKENVDALAGMLVVRTVGSKHEKRKREALRTLNRISDSLAAFVRHADLVYWMEEAGHPSGGQPEGVRFPTLMGIPKNLGEQLHRDLWSRDIPVILTSGTLSAAGDFEHVKKKTGLDLVPHDRLSETSKPSPFNYRENAVIYISEDTPFPDSQYEGYLTAITDETENLIHAAHGHAAVLFTSYKAMDMVHGHIAARGLPYPLFRLDRGGAAAIERFRESKNGVLFASGALWEGIDIPGDVLSILIIVRLPFAVPDPVSEWERTLYRDMDEYKKKVVVPEMLVKLKQGFGRLIRSESDTGVCAILDSRAAESGAYRRRVLSALPPCRVTSSIADVETFIKERKSEGYFTEGTICKTA